MTIICFDLATRRISTMAGTPGDGAPSTNGPVLTSLVYPLEVVEAVDVASALVFGFEYDPVGHIDVVSDLVSGSLTATIEYESFDTEAEAIDVATDLVTGALTVTIEYESHDANPENVDVTSDLAAGSLTVVINYITHEDPATDEGFDVSSDLVSGTLA